MCDVQVGIDLKKQHGSESHSSEILFIIVTVDYVKMSLVSKVNYIIYIFQKMSANSRNSNI